MRLIDAEPIERALFRRADKSLAKNPYENAKICAFRRAFELVLDAPTITSLPNDPLTLEELRGMDWEPVYMVDLIGGPSWDQWIIFKKSTDDGFAPLGGGFFITETYGRTWLAYRRKPEGRMT